MSEEPRRSNRVRKTPARYECELIDFDLYDSGQGLVVKRDNKQQLAIAEEDMDPSSREILVTWLEPTESKLAFTKGESGQCDAEAIVSDFKYTLRKGLVVITTAQLKIIEGEGADDYVQQEDDEEEEEEQVAAPKLTKRPRGPRAARAPSAPRVKKAKRTEKKAKPKVLKIGKFNPNMPSPPVPTELLWNSSDQPLFGECILTNSKNFHRAVTTNNPKLFEALMESEQQVAGLCVPWSADFPVTPLMLAACLGNEFFIESIIEAITKGSLCRGTDPPVALQAINTGQVSVMAYGRRTRKVQMSRGGKEGNNAFMHEPPHNESLNSLTSPTQLREMIRQGVAPAVLDLLEVSYHSFEDTMLMQVGEVVRSGNVAMALHLIRRANKRGGFGFTPLYETVLSDDALGQVKKPSITKKPIENYLVAPLHTACINPDPTHLGELLALCDDPNYPDSEGRRCMHYAAACESDAPVNLLISKHLNVNETDSQKVTPLMVSAIYDRPHAALALLKAGALPAFKNKEGMTAVHYAALHGSLETLKVLISQGANANVAGAESKTPLMCAAMRGQFECLQFLIEHGARVNRRDRRKRTALIFAVKNGFAKETCYLLEQGADYDDPDSSGNSPLHYAAAYGWVQCIDLLLQAGADVNVTNDWKLPPLLVALLKSKADCVFRLLQVPEVDVNCKDERGRTLLSQTFEVLSRSRLRQAEFLIKEKGADPNIPDLEGKTALHHLLLSQTAFQHYNLYTSYTREAYIEQVYRWKREAIELLVLVGNADPNLPDSTGSSPLNYLITNSIPMPSFNSFGYSGSNTNDCGKRWQIETIEFFVLQAGANLNYITPSGELPIFYALQNRNLDLVRMLMRLNADLAILRSDGSNIFHSLWMLELGFIELYIEFLDHPSLQGDSLFQPTNQGLLPFHSLVLFYLAEYPRTQQLIRNRITTEMQNELNAMQGMQQQQSSSIFGTIVRPQIDYEECERRVQAECRAIQEAFKDLLNELIRRGCDPAAIVDKLVEYRKGPEEIHKRYEEAYPNNSSQYIRMDYDGTWEWNEYGPYGRQNILHFLVNNPSEEFLELFCSWGVNMNQRDFSGMTPLTKLSQSGNTAFLQAFLDKGADPNIFTCTGEAPVHYLSLNEQALSILIKHGAELNILSYTDKAPLHTAVLQKHLPIIKLLCKSGADPNLRNSENRTALHMAFNAADCSANTSFELESLLLVYGADLNALDNAHRTPLHYAFVKLQSLHDTSEWDPIETVSSACARSAIAVNVQDESGRTPLHYAANRGALTSTMFLLSKGAELNQADHEGNTPLALALLSQHSNYAVTLIQRGADFNIPVIIPDPEEDESNRSYRFGRRQQYQRNVFSQFNQRNYSSSSYLSPGSYTMFRVCVILNLQGPAYMMLFSGYDYMKAMEDSINECKFQLVRTLLAKACDDAALAQLNAQQQTLFHVLAIKGASSEAEVLQNICEQLADRGVGMDSLDEDQRTPLHYSIPRRNQVLTSFLLERDCRLEVPDVDGDTAMILFVKQIQANFHYLQLAVGKGAKVDFTYYENELLRTPLINSLCSGANEHITQFLLDNGASLVPDHSGKTPIMYALVQSRLLSLEMLIKYGATVHGQDTEGTSALMYAVLCHSKAKVCRFLLEHGAPIDLVNKHGQDVLIQAILRRSKLKIVQTLLTAGASLTTVDQQGQDVIIHAVVNKAPLEILRALLQAGAPLTTVDNTGRNAVMHAIVQNNTAAAALLSKRGGLDLSQTGSDGKTALHYVVQPFAYGSFENVEILKLLLDAGADAYQVDAYGNSSYYYACQQRSGILRQVFESYGLTPPAVPETTPSEYSLSIPQPDFETDAHNFVKSQPSYRNEEVIMRQPDQEAGGFGNTYSVIDDFDIYMTKVDLSFGPYSAYLFYRMQLLHESNRDVYVLVTRWGRIGESGAHQRTPFSGREEAEQEFRKIFRNKTRNDWGTPFTHMRGKYRLMEQQTRRIHYSDFVKKIEFTDVVESSLSQELYEAFEIATHVESYNGSLRGLRLSTSSMNFSHLSRKQLDEGEALLVRLSELVKALDEATEVDEKIDIKEKIYDASSQFYQVIPYERSMEGPVPPLLDKQEIVNIYSQIETLKNIEVASKIILGALQSKNTVNPVDYLLSCIPVNIEPLQYEHPEHELIRKYITMGGGNSQHVYNIFKLNRKGEPERILKYKDISSRQLLWHGTKVTNLVGILCRGLLIAPAGIPATGWMFGKGVYFANIWAKSQGYCDSYTHPVEDETMRQKRSYFMFLCEVVLGEPYKQTSANCIERLPEPYGCTLGMGRTTPDESGTVRTKNGIQVPLGQMTNRNDMYISLSYDEYIVYNTDQIRLRYLVHFKQF